MRLLQVAGTLNPTYGGPPVVLNHLTEDVTALGHSVDVVTLDAPSAPWLRDAPGPPRAFGPAVGKYGYSRRLKRWLRAHVADYDAVLVHGIWQYQSLVTSHACRRAQVPYFVFAHGALDPWFQDNYLLKHAKKSLYWRLFEHRALRDARAVLFTREEERRLARSSFSPYHVHEAVMDIGVRDPGHDAAGQRAAFLATFPELETKRILLFLSRIHPKKGCDLLIRAFAAACRFDPDLHLVAAGPDEGGTRADLESLADVLGIGHRITWAGMLTGDVKWGAFHAADVFVLPSHSENFGIVVVEALACGLPVLITDKVNLWRDIADARAGFIESDTVAGVTTALERWLALDENQRVEMGTRARRCFVEQYDSRSTAVTFVDRLSQTIGVNGR